MAKTVQRRSKAMASASIGRPCFSEAECQAVRSALDAMPADFSLRSRVALLARRVATELRVVDRRDEDPLEAAILRVRYAIAADPVSSLVRDTDFGALGMLARARLARFEARGCQQLSPTEWNSETDKLSSEIERKLTERYRRVAKKMGVN